MKVEIQIARNYLFDLFVFFYVDGLEDFIGFRTAYPENIGQTDFYSFFFRQINTGNSCQNNLLPLRLSNPAAVYGFDNDFNIAETS